MDLLKYLNSRLGEPSSLAGIAAMLAMLHVNVDPGVLHQATLWASVVSAVLSVILAEQGKKPAQIASDAVGAFVGAVKAMPVDSNKGATP